MTEKSTIVMIRPDDSVGFSRLGLMGIATLPDLRHGSAISIHKAPVRVITYALPPPYR
jgi:hypothetical protein